MNDYERELIDELLEAEEMFDIDDRAIKCFERESRQSKQDRSKKLNKKINKVKIDFMNEKE